MKTIDGKILKDAIIHGINELDKHKEIINALNVFPVPDGDTGTNMTMTANTAGKEVEKLDTSDIFAVAKAASGGSLRGARGNSGVILSQLFRGFAKGLEGKTEVDTKGLAVAFVKAMESAYKAVMKPKEGTILTIAKALAESAEKSARVTKNIDEMLELMLKDAHKMLIQTEFMLQELTDAGVVDAGGRGLLYVLEGALHADYSKPANLNTPTAPSATPAMPAGNAAAHASGDIEFGYCTEMFIDLSSKKGSEVKNAPAFEDIEQELLTFLDDVGDSVVLVGDENVVKIHVHTNNPGAVMERSLTYGDLSSIKIENMRLQHEEMVSFATDVRTTTTPVATAMPTQQEKPVGILAVASGDGFAEIFKDLNVDYVIEGGQTMNPSTESFLDAIEHINAKDIIIMPNNSNIILAAQQAQKMSNKTIHVLVTKTVPEGIAAMYAYDLSKDVPTILANMEKAVKNTKTGQVTYAVKDTSYKNLQIKNGDILCMLGNEIVDAKQDIHEGAIALLQTMAKDSPEFINIYYGQEATEDGAKKLANYIEENHPDVEVEVRNGGQSHYFYVMSAE